MLKLFLQPVVLCHQGQILFEQADESPRPKVPPMLKRRLSKLAKQLAPYALHALDGKSLPVIWDSMHGNISKAVSLLNDAVAQADMSPTDFSLSVHNSDAGVLSMMANNHAPITATSCAKNRLKSILVEAEMMRRENDSDVLVVMCDDTIPAEYLQALSVEGSYAVFLVSEDGIEVDASVLKLDGEEAYVELNQLISPTARLLDA